jgi:hypothetical protein
MTSVEQYALLASLLSDEERYVVTADFLFSSESGLRPEWRQMIGQWYLQVVCLFCYSLGELNLGGNRL